MLFELVGTPLRRLIARALLLGVLIVGLNAVFTASVSAASGINQQLNFQGRLLNSQGAVVADGYYNVEFKIYQDGPGTTAGNPGGTLKWTEDWLNGGTGTPVKVVNGYISVQLGSITPFGTSVDWNQDTLWLSVNIGNKTSCTIVTSFNTDCGGDGEMVPMKRLSAVPYALNSAKLGGLAASDFIQNTTTQQAGTNFNISGTGTAVTLQASTFDTASAGVLSLGTTNATSITLAKNVTVAAGMSLTLSGGATATRPASPTEGMLYYDTTTKQLLVYANGKWQSDRTTSTKIVAASNSSQAEKDAADYVATGTGDQAQINSALTAAAGGKVYLLEGTYSINASISVPNNTTLAGAGSGTVITIPNSLNTSINAITNTTTGGSGTGVTIQDLELDGNKANQSSGTMHGIYLNGIGASTTLSGCTIRGVSSSNWLNYGLYLNASSNNTLTGNTTTGNNYGIALSSTTNTTLAGNTSQGNTGHGILLSSSNYNTVTGNTMEANGSNGIYVNSSNNNTIASNTAQGNTSYGLYLNTSVNNTLAGNTASGNSIGIVLNTTSNNNTVTGNTVQGSSSYGLDLNASSSNTVAGNRLTDNGGAANNNSIYVTGSSSNNITGNTITDASATTTNYAINIVDNTSNTTYLAGNTLGGGSINDAGTGTIYGGQVNVSGNFLIQPAGTIELLKGTNVTGAITGTSSLTLGTSSSVNGTVVLKNATNVNTLTILSAAQSASYTATIPVLGANDTFCMVTLANCGSSGGSYIQNQSSSQQASSNFWISGTGRADTAFITPSIRAATDSTNAIALQNAAGTATVLSVDTVNNRIGIGTTAPSTALDVETNDTSTNRLQALIKQSGSGDSGVEMNSNGQSYYVGIDTSDASAFKIGSSSATGSTATTGTTTIGGSMDSGAYDSYTYAKITATTTGTITSLRAYVGNTGTTPKAVMGIYSSISRPGTLMGTTSELSLTSNAWNTFTLTAPVNVTSGTVYYLVYSANGSGAGDNNLAYSNGASNGDSGYYSPRTYSSTLPSTAPVWTSTAVYYSMYAVISSGAPGDQFTGALLRMSTTGQTLFKNSTDTTTGFQVQNTSGIGVLNVDTSNARVGINLGSAETASYDLTFGGSADRYLGINTNTATGAGRKLTVQGGTGNAGAGGILALLGGAGNGTNQAGGAVNISGGTPTGTGAVGAVNIQTTLNGNVTIGNAGNAANTVTLVAGSTNGIILTSDKIMVGNATTATTIQKTAQTTAATAGQQLTIQGATSGTTGVGGLVVIQGGNSATGTLGGNLSLAGGTGSTSNGLVILGTSAFNTNATDTGCYPSGADSTSTTNCTIAQSSVNNFASVIVGFTNNGQTSFMPNPSITTAGRVVYVTASPTTKDFTLSVNGGGTGNQIAMRKNTTATMIWNGSAWTAAGASSSTTLQAAYDNTLQSAGGAELVVSKTSTTNGLTIRDSSTNPVNGTLLSVQTQSAAGLFQVNGNVTEYVSDAGAEVSGASSNTFPASTWTNVGSATVSRYTTAGNYIATGQGSVSVVTTATNNDGVKNQLVSALTSNMTYNVSFTTRLTSGTFTDMNVYYSVDGTTASLPCTTAATSATSVWTKVNCTFTAPASGITSSNAILIRQTTAVARTFYVDNLSVTVAANYNLATDGGVDNAGTFTTNWPSVGGSTVTRSTTSGNDASDSAQVATTGANQGVGNKLSMNPLSSTLYRVTAYVNITSGSFNNFTVSYTPDGGTTLISCADYNTQTINVSPTIYTMVTCYITTGATTVTNPYVYFTQTDATARTFNVDTVSVTLNSNNTPNVQIGGGINGGPVTLLTLDRAASAPIAANNDALLGSMYYDTTLGKLQCYEADGWGACGSSPDNIITISPEYTNAVLHGPSGGTTGVGTMTSDLCSGPLQINDGLSGRPSVCGATETYNFYKWTSPQSTSQTYAIYVTYQLPGTFKSFNSGQTSIMARTDNGPNGGAASVSYKVYKNSSSGLAQCGTSSVAVSSGTVSSWQTGTATGAADPSTCGFGAGNSIVFEIDMSTSKNANAYVGNLNFAFSNK